jgi:hypothetical protein
VGAQSIDGDTRLVDGVGDPRKCCDLSEHIIGGHGRRQ